ncbi:hypothetical protein GCM10009092_13150 [Bowmanella denitrificans]|uniref:Iron uptake protein n=1 Tax=Bowmanella denitrificans TaxID=366582 RepID=A0ABN0WYB5_9ALTE|nr:hypothetical protein [Bowmanella denitrificans]
MARRERIQPHWWSKSLAGVLLGFVLAIGITGLFAWLGPGGLHADNKIQFNMWISALIWMVLFACVYLFSTGLKAWLWLGGASIAVWSLLVATQLLMQGGA